MTLDALVDAWLDDDLDAGRIAALSELLRTPEGRRDFRRALRLHGALGRELGARPSQVLRRLPASPRRRRQPRHVWWPYALAAGAVLLVGAAAIALARPQQQPPALPIAVQPAPTVTPPIVAPLPAADLPRLVAGSGAGFPTGGVLAIGQAFTASSASTLAWSDGTRLDLRPGSALRVEAPGPDHRVRLDHGTLLAEVTPQRGSFRIASEHGDVRVIGTRFTMAAGQRAVQVQVERGTVELTSPAGRLPVTAGQRAVAAAAALPQLVAEGDLLPAVDPADWFGRPGPDGVAAILDPEQSAKATVDTWRVATPAADAAGHARVRADLRCQIDLHLDRPGQIAVVVFVWSGKQWRANLQLERDLPAGDTRLDEPLSAFRTQSGAALADLIGQGVHQTTVVTWQTDPGLTVRRIAWR
jgi:hypothetical protein